MLFCFFFFAFCRIFNIHIPHMGNKEKNLRKECFVTIYFGRLFVIYLCVNGSYLASFFQFCCFFIRSIHITQCLFPIFAYKFLIFTVFVFFLIFFVHKANENNQKSHKYVRFFFLKFRFNGKKIIEKKIKQVNKF